MHYLAATTAFLAAVLYADRTGYLYKAGTQTRWALVTRAGMIGLLLAVGAAFMSLAALGRPFTGYHVPVLLFLAAVAVGHLGMRATSAPPT